MGKTPDKIGARPDVLADVFHHRWAVPVLAELARRGGAKFVTLCRGLGVGRDTLSRTLKALDAKGWVQRNPGHGHPMRPEYILTPAGKRVGRACIKLDDQLANKGRADVGFKKWSMPVLLAIGNQRCRFAQLSTILEASPRALTQALKALVETRLVERHLIDDYPPRPEYVVSKSGRVLLPALRGLAIAAGGQ